MKAFARCVIQLALAIAFATSLSSCNTIKGAGRDIEKVGEGIQKEAEKHD